MTECEKKGHLWFAMSDPKRKICLKCGIEAENNHIADAEKMIDDPRITVIAEDYYLHPDYVSIVKLLSDEVLRVVEKVCNEWLDSTEEDYVFEHPEEFIKLAISAAIERAK